MADIALAVAQTLLAALQCSEIKEMCSDLGYKSQLKDLQETVDTVRKVLLDAAAKRDLISNEAQDYIQKLKDAVYDADDLFDEFRTLAELKQLNQEQHGDQFFQKVRDFFSPDNQLRVAFKTSRKVKKIRRKLDAIVDNHHKFGLSLDYTPIRRRREETCSYVFAPDVIGREDDKKAIVDKLLDSNVTDDVSFLTIVGVGGLGKTTLAQLVFDDDKIKNEYPQFRLWVCVSDQDGVELDEKVTLAKILESIPNKEMMSGDFTLQHVQTKFQERLRGKKYLLVLDDVWNEDRQKWLDLRKFLMVGQRGSRIVVTTRSHITANVIGNEHCTYELGGLAPENSWRLFEMTAFDKGQEISPELVEIGEKIVQKCSNLPLSIKVVASVLYGQEQSRWQSFEENKLAEISQGEKGVMNILKFSYYNLEPSLKGCFSYCAIFPKDFKIQKEDLISLWMAQGCIVPFGEGQSIEDAAEDHFLILLRRCFFQDVKTDKWGHVFSCKIHDFMHDVAEEVAKEEIFKATPNQDKVGDKIRHIFDGHGMGESTKSSFNESKIRSYLRTSSSQIPSSRVDNLLSKWKCLRALDLRYLDIESLPDSIGQLLHLRYLDLSGNDKLQTLCSSITKLHNLQTLKLFRCGSLRELPKDLSKLLKLRHLDILDCDMLTYMPSGMDKLTCLCVLTRFIVAAEGNSNRGQCVGQLEDLKALKEIKGPILISVLGSATNVSKNDGEGGCLSSMRNLKVVTICFEYDSDAGNNNNKSIFHEAMLKKLEPNPNLRGLVLLDYHGATIPRWGRGDNWATVLRNLVNMRLYGCGGLQHLTSLSELAHLKTLDIFKLTNLEYMENTTSSNCSSSYAASSRLGSDVAELPLLPSLEYLKLLGLPKLKGWWRDVGLVNTSNTWEPLFPRLSKLEIRQCPNLTSFPLCPSVEELTLFHNDEKLQIRRGKAKGDNLSALGLHTPNSTSLRISNVCCLKSLSLTCVTDLVIFFDEKMESLSEAGEVFKSYSLLRYLEISCCSNLRSLCGGLEHLTALETLRIERCPNLTFPEEDDDMPWRPLHQSLRSLDLCDLQELEILPKGMQCLTSLQDLTFSSCENLRALPDWISCLSSLQSLSIVSCNNLKSLPEAMRDLKSLRQLDIWNPNSVLWERCQNQSGEDWPNIKHIPQIKIG